MQYTKELVRDRLASDPRWAERAIIVLFDRQTYDEQHTSETRENNGIGFNGLDAEILSSFARWLQAGRHLSPKQLAIAHKKLPKYAGQILSVINEASAS